MTRLAKLLKNRVTILQPTKEVNSAGGFNRGYKRISQVWSELKPIAQASRDIAAFVANIRGTQVNSVATHKMKVRRIAVVDIGANFNSGFNRGFAISGSLQILKSEYYVFLPLSGDNAGDFDAGFDTGFANPSERVGNLYRIVAGVDNESDHEYLEIRLMEVEEQGTGAPA